MFYNFTEDTDDHLRQMLEQDLNYGKFSIMIRKEEDKIAVKEVLLQYYLQIKNIFLHIASTSQYPCISSSDYMAFCKRSKIIDNEVISAATLERTLSQTNFSKNPHKNSADRELHRYEFVEIIVRIALEKFCATKVCKNAQGAVEKLLVEHILPNN